MSDVVLSPANAGSTQSVPVRFAFGGAPGEVLREHFLRDAERSRLSTKFRLYYRFRPYIPVAVRQMLQRGHNRGISVPESWYKPSEFSDDFLTACKSEPDAVAVHPWPDGFQTAAVLTHDIETKVGVSLVDKLAALEEEYGLRSAWNFIPYKYSIDRGLQADLKQRGHEIGVHGYKHDGRLFESRQTFDERSGPINRAIADFGSTGFRSPMAHRNLEWLQSLDIDYDTSCFDIDPFQPMPGGVGGVWPFIVGKFVEMPYTLPQDHTLLISLGEETPGVWIDKMAYLRSLAGMALVVTHPDYLTTSQRLDVYRKFLEHLAEQSGCWNALPHQISGWWRQRDEIELVSDGDLHRLIGPSAERARTILLSELHTKSDEGI